ncbi:hypothetical protein C8U37_11562 [Trichococcus patagoniensis]|uniref:Uncharacterized protein n=1 Tax=Trichococcus patagoniensis TaxID=382641 RepID=A0A2T5IGM3_9LACT|nr:hypothetical protein [Trichococcus patagoniensis]PTQ82984.1 hypothetical protein C8U37_11562 [Trichococcus patagoniensis]
MKKKYLMIGLISFTALTTFAVSTPIEAAMMDTVTYENHGQYVRSHATHLRHHAQMNGVSMHARDRDDNLSCSAQETTPSAIQ